MRECSERQDICYEGVCQRGWKSILVEFCLNSYLKDERGVVFGDAHCISYRRESRFCKLLNVRGVNYVGQT